MDNKIKLKVPSPGTVLRMPALLFLIYLGLTCLSWNSLNLKTLRSEETRIKGRLKDMTLGVALASVYSSIPLLDLPYLPDLIFMIPLGFP